MKRPKAFFKRISRGPRRWFEPVTPVATPIEGLPPVTSPSASIRGCSNGLLGHEPAVDDILSPNSTSQARPSEERPQLSVLPAQSTSQQAHPPRPIGLTLSSDNTEPLARTDGLDQNDGQVSTSSRSVVPDKENCEARGETSLQEAMDEFKRNYQHFVSKNNQYITIKEELEGVFETHTSTSDIAKILEARARTTVEAIDAKKHERSSKWVNKVGEFFITLSPVARLACSLTAAVGQGPSALKGAATGLGIILQLLEEEAGRCDDFLYHLRRVEYLATLVADNPNYDLGLETSMRILNAKSTDLMCAVINFFNSALLYLKSGFFANLTKSVWKGPDVYTKGKERLDMVIREYDQAIMHLTAMVVSNTKYQQRVHTKGELLQWLAPSYWSVESYLHSFRHQRAEETLKWARDMAAFADWRLSGLDPESRHRITWIHGTLGVGKSIMAAYYIDLLKCQYPKAIVSYFFCRSKEVGVFTPRDILRALAYQCMEQVSGASDTLKELKSHGFMISDDLGIGYLFEMLILDPMQKNEKETFIVLDGVDEADTEPCDRSGKPELHVLLTCLSRLPNTRLLCISRPSADVSRVLPFTFEKRLQQENTQTDISLYVTKTIQASSRLQMLFHKTRVEPIRYFENKGSGVFLWVVLVLQQLEKSRTLLAFQKCLEGFSKATGSMEALYSAILARIPDHEKPWVKEILLWVSFSRLTLHEDELYYVSTMSLQEEFVEFRKFLDVECGSFLSRVNPGWSFRLVHETFRSFLLDPEKCHPDFLLDEESSHGHILTICLQSLLEEDKVEFGRRYSQRNWVSHLKKTREPRLASRLLSALHSYITSDGLFKWLRISDDHLGAEESLKKIYEWLCEHATAYIDCSETDEVPVGNWLRLVVHADRDWLGQETGKAAGRLWATEVHRRQMHQSPERNQGLFRLALKYYCRRPGRTQSNLAELLELKSTQFTGMLTWAAPSSQDQLQVLPINLGLAYYSVYSWDQFLMRCEDDSDILSGTSKRRLMIAFLRQQEYGRAVQFVIKNLTKFTNVVEDVLPILLRLDNWKGVLDPLLSDSFLQFQPGIQFSHSWWDDLERALRTRGTPEKTIIAVLDRLVPGYDDMAYWNTVYNIYNREWGGRVAIRRLKEAVESSSESEALNLCLAKAYNNEGNHDLALEAIEKTVFLAGSRRFSVSKTIPLIPDSRWQRPLESARALLGKGKARAAIAHLEVLRTHWEVLPPDYSSELFDVFIKAYEIREEGMKSIRTQVLEKMVGLCHNSYVIQILSQAHMDDGNVAQSIEVLTAALGKTPPGSTELSFTLLDLYIRAGQYDNALHLLENIHEMHKWPVDPFGVRLLELYGLKDDYQGVIKKFEPFIRMHNQNGCGAWPIFLIAMAKTGQPEAGFKQVDVALDDGLIKWTSNLAYTMFDIYKKQGKYEAAIERFSALVTNSPLESWTWHLLGEVYHACGQPTKSIEVYRSAFEMYHDYSFLCRLCSVHYEVGEYSNALKYYENARDMGPYATPWQYLVHRETDRFFPVITIIEIDEQLLQHFLWYQAAKSYEALEAAGKAINLYQEALVHYETVVEQEKNEIMGRYTGFKSDSICVFWLSSMPRPMLWYLIGELHRELGDSNNAITAFEKAFQSEPTNHWLKIVIQNTRSMLEERREDDSIIDRDSNEDRRMATLVEE